MPVSQFKPFAMGTAAENKPLTTNQLMVVPHEHLPFLDGELVSDPQQMNYQTTTADGTASEGKVFTDNVIEATWLPESSNRLTAPDVRRGERILLYQYGDADKYYWRPAGLDDHKRKLETVIFVISANPNEGNDVLNPETSYFIEISSHNKHIVMHTSMANGEAVSFDTAFDLSQGIFSLKDNLNNELHIRSLESYVRLVNTDKTKLELNRRKFLLEASEEGVIQVGSTKMTFRPDGTTLKTPKFDGSQ